MNSCIDRITHVTFRIFALGGADARNKVGEYVSLGFRVGKGKISEEEILTSIKDIGKEHPMETVIGGVEAWNECYVGWTEELRYILYRYDEKLAKDAGEEVSQVQWEKIWGADASSSIEHIFPQRIGRSDIHNLGNLTMLPPKVNSSLGGKPPSEKADRYIVLGIKIDLKRQQAEHQVHRLSDLFYSTLAPGPN